MNSWFEIGFLYPKQKEEDLKNLLEKNIVIQREKADLAEEVKNLMVIIQS